MGDWAVHVQPRLNPSWIEGYIDTEATARRLVELELAGKVPESAKKAVSQFLKEFKMIEAGKNPVG